MPVFLPFPISARCRSVELTPDLEGDIAHLKGRGELDDEGQKRLATLESELKFVQKLKEKYVAEHPDSRDKVFHTREREQAPRSSAARPEPMAHLYNPDGTLRDPKRSIYYDATYNPFGVPPPGMPYAERRESPYDRADSSTVRSVREREQRRGQRQRHCHA